MHSRKLSHNRKGLLYPGIIETLRSNTFYCKKTILKNMVFTCEIHFLFFFFPIYFIIKDPIKNSIYQFGRMLALMFSIQHNHVDSRNQNSSRAQLE